MQILPFIIFSIMIATSSIYSAEALLPQSGKEMATKKRTAPTVNLPSKKPKLEEIDWDDHAITVDKMKKRLEYKAGILENELPRVHESLNQIAQKLTEKARSSKNTNLERSVTLASIVTGINFISNSATTILKNLKGRDLSQPQSVTNVSMAIIASGALKSQLKEVIRILTDDHDMRDINHETLIGVNKSLEIVTKNIANPVLVYE